MRLIKTMVLSSVLLIPVLNTPAQAANASSVFDIDGNGQSEALSDGLLLLRYLFGFNGTSLTNGAVGTNASRSSATQIIDYIENPPSVGLTIRALNDTGITDSSPAGTDGTTGRDVTHNDDSDGHAGFSFTKLSAAGAPLAASAANWSCVKDNVTGLIWEVKTTDGGMHDSSNTYTWYNPYINTNGGDAGTESGADDTDSFVKAVNAASLCGASDWRMPTIDELVSIVDYSASEPSIDTAFFPNNTSSGYYWSSSPKASNSDYALDVRFSNGFPRYHSKQNGFHVRLVRSGL